MRVYIESFLPLFVAIDVIGTLPMFLALTDGVEPLARRRLTFHAVWTALLIALAILFAGQLIFRLLGITVNDLRVGGGIVLLVLSITELVGPSDNARGDLPRSPQMGIVPLGSPLIMGPAAITAVLVTRESFGYLPTLASLLLNLAIVLGGFLAAPLLVRVIGNGAAAAVGKVSNLFLAAISVAMIRSGVVGIVRDL